jgi:AraC-like DNA-binding protein
MVVHSILKELDINDNYVDLGVIELLEPLSEDQRRQLREKLLEVGLELIEDNKSILVERVKNIVTEMIQYDDDRPNINYSDYISEKLGYDYTYLSNVFSEVKGMTIQQYIILHKIEKVKELILYDELNLSEISYKLNYSSVAHLSNQFKKITGLSPSFFKQLKQKRNSNLENL